MQERRLFPRHPFIRDLVLVGGNGHHFSGRSTDLSMGGITMCMPRAAVVGLAQGGKNLMPGDQVTVRMAEVIDSQTGIELKCRVTNVRRLSQDEYLVGAWLSDSEPNSHVVLAQLVQIAAGQDQTT